MLSYSVEENIWCEVEDRLANKILRWKRSFVFKIFAINKGKKSSRRNNTKKQTNTKATPECLWTPSYLKENETFPEDFGSFYIFNAP